MGRRVATNSQIWLLGCREFRGGGGERGYAPPERFAAGVWDILVPKALLTRGQRRMFNALCLTAYHAFMVSGLDFVRAPRRWPRVRRDLGTRMEFGSIVSSEDRFVGSRQEGFLVLFSLKSLFKSYYYHLSQWAFKFGDGGGGCKIL